MTTLLAESVPSVSAFVIKFFEFLPSQNFIINILRKFEIDTNCKKFQNNKIILYSALEQLIKEFYHN